MLEGRHVRLVHARGVSYISHVPVSEGRKAQLPERFEAAPPLVLVDAPSQAALWSACERAVGGFDV